jgi:two-component system OmpR family sensor kinase
VSPPHGLDWALSAASVAHEIRAPLLAVRAALESALIGGPGVDVEALLRRSLLEIEELAASIEGVLGWAGGGRAPHRTGTDLHQLVRDVAGRWTIGTQTDRVVVRGSGSMPAMVDADGVRLAVANLIRNALEYSDAGTKVDVSVAPEGDEAYLVSVRNQRALGGSVDPEAAFAPLTRGEVGGRNPFGMGLGLFLARLVVEAHGGTISFETPGAETLVCLRLPVSPP